MGDHSRQGGRDPVVFPGRWFSARAISIYGAYRLILPIQRKKVWISTHSSGICYSGCWSVSLTNSSQFPGISPISRAIKWLINPFSDSPRFAAKSLISSFFPFGTVKFIWSYAFKLYFRLLLELVLPPIYATTFLLLYHIKSYSSILVQSTQQNAMHTPIYLCSILPWLLLGVCYNRAIKQRAIGKPEAPRLPQKPIPTGAAAYHKTATPNESKQPRNGRPDQPYKWPECTLTI